MQCCLEPLRQHCLRLLPVQCCPQRMKTILKRILSCAMLSGASRTSLDRVFPVQCFPRSIRQHYTGFFPVQCCLEPLGRQSKRGLHVQCYPKSIKITLNRDFSCAMLFVVQDCTRFLPVQCWPMANTGLHLGFSEGRGPNFRKGANQYKTKKKQCKSYIGDNFLIIKSYKRRYTYDCR